MKNSIYNHESVKIPFLALLLFLFFMRSIPCFSQADARTMARLVERMDSVAGGEPPQIVYLQTSKGVYEPMEDLWFKAYIMDSRAHSPSKLCQTLYLEMINESSGQVVWREKYLATDGFVDGHVYVHDTLSVGDYLLAAYTSLSYYGDDPEMKAVRRVQVRSELLPNYDGWVGPTKKTIVSEEKETPVQFNTFPEGGNLVAGVEGRMAFKAVNPDGTPVNARGTLFEGSDTLLAFESEHDGMGSFMFTPEIGKEYRIRLSEPYTDSVYMLPEIYGEGVSLRLASRNDDFLEFRVSRGPFARGGTVYLMGQIRGILCCIASGELTDELTVRIPLEEFPFQGIAEFTLFDGDLVPIAERLVYIHPEKKLYVTTELDKNRYDTREKVTVKITVKDENGEPAKANLGVTVHDRLHQNLSDPLNMFTYCYLTSQLRGKIHGPGYYFDERNKDREEAMDLLMLTQGWRRYVWSAADPAPNDPEERRVVYDWVEGELGAKAMMRNRVSLEEQYVKVYFPNSSDEAYFVSADSAGKFAITPEHLEAGRGSYVYMSPMGEKNLGLTIDLKDPFEAIDLAMRGKETNYPLAGTARSSEEDVPLGRYVEGMRTLELPEVTVKARGEAVFRDRYIGRLDSIAKSETGVWVCSHGYLENYRPGYSHLCKDTARIVPVEGKTYRVIKYGDSDRPGFGRVVDVYDVVFYYPRISEKELLKMNNLSRIRAYYVHREFYRPVYDETSPPDGYPDFRNTLLWSPLTVTDENGEATVEFYCSDLNTGFVGTIEGLNGEGLLCNENFEFSVIKAKPSDQGN
jgi:hypothetical protein